MADKIFAWQNRLLPFVVVMLTILIVSFLTIGTFYAFSLNNKNDELISSHIGNIYANSIDWKNLSDESKARLILEEKSMNHRFVNIINSNKYNVWMRYSAYLIGTILCFIGAIFILSKITESMTNLSGQSPNIKITLATSSPGLILAFLGTILIIVGIYKTVTVDVSEAPKYIVPQYRIKDLTDVRKKLTSDFANSINREDPL